MSDREQVIERWQAPFFDAPSATSSQPAPADLLAVAQASGFQEGRKEGLEQGRQEAREITESMLALAREMSQPFLSMDQLVVKELARMAMILAEQIVRRELAVDSAVVVQVVSEALATLSSLEGDIEIHLNPRDAALIRDLAPEFLEGISWKLVETADILCGGCRVKTPVSLVDATVEKQMEKAFASLLESAENKLEC